MDKPIVLIVEDEEAIRTQLKWALSDDYELLMAGDRPAAVDLKKKKNPTLVLLDLGLPPSPRGGEEGLKALSEILLCDPAAKVVVVTGNQEKEIAMRAVGLGAFDFFTKPAEMGEVKVVLRRALHIAGLEKGAAAGPDGAGGFGAGEIVGRSPQMEKIYAVIRKVAATDAPVLVEGESGTGKELVAKAIHRSGPDGGAGPFVIINCGAIPRELLESELFGHEKGSFTGADIQRKGKIEYAAGGTLFLDEIGELPLGLQVKILRFLQEYEIERVGGRETIRVKARVIAATHRDLEKEMREGRFREDLYYRLGVVAIRVPPLRERGEDVAILASHFLARFSEAYRKPIKGFSPSALAAIRSYPWPGNVRELENKVKRAVIMSDGRLLTAEDLAIPAITGDRNGAGDSLRDVRSRVEREHVVKVLARCGWNISKAATELGVSRPTLHDLIKKYGITRNR
ncbi:MAG: PEP-CTERM-box response regulator transcription factor [Deltaproteobacteria bacterium]|nr:PEP-CTERM-box response regulator transcription factor [Deltaproteobacteria bacterium]